MRKKIIIAVMLLLIMQIGFARGEDKVIGAGKTVKFDYSLKVDGKVIDSSEGKEPLEYVQGQGMIIPGLEKQLEGLKVGDQKTISVAAADAYGEVNEQLFKEFPKDMIAEGINPQVGQMLQLQDNQGRVIPAMVAEVKEDTVLLNFNHPLAGQDLVFDVSIVDIQ